MPIAVTNKVIVLFIIMLGTLSFPVDANSLAQSVQKKFSAARRVGKELRYRQLTDDGR